MTPDKKTDGFSTVSDSTDQNTKLPHQRITDILRRRFFAGLIVVVPIGIMIFAILFLFVQVDKLLGEHIRTPIASVLELISWPTELAKPISIAVSFFLIFAVIVFIGGLSKFLLVRRMIGIGEWIISKLPLVRFFYQTPKEVIKIMTEQKNSVKRVVMVQYPKENTWAMAYATSEMIHAPDGKKMVTVFIPTTPNPTSGFMLMYPAEEVLDMNISTEDAVRMIISGGILSPETYHTETFTGLNRIPHLPPAPPLTSGDEHVIVTPDDVASSDEEVNSGNPDKPDQ